LLNDVFVVQHFHETISIQSCLNYVPFHKLKAIPLLVQYILLPIPSKKVVLHLFDPNRFAAADLVDHPRLSNNIKK
jgi:hypothetical protein